MYEKIVIVTKKTRFEELIERFNTREQAKFYIEHMGLDFLGYEQEHRTYQSALTRLRHDMEALGPKVQVLDRVFLPNFIFAETDLVVTAGPDGLVVNTAKYLRGQPIVAVNVDPVRFDGILLPFGVEQARLGVLNVLRSRAHWHDITMAEAVLNDGQRLFAFNDFLVGQRTHVSARYELTWQSRHERQSSSGVLISTGAGSTGWLSSAQHMAESVGRLVLQERAPKIEPIRLAWNDPRLVFVVREPFLSKASGIRLTAGFVERGESLDIESLMPEGGVIFSDGIEADSLAFNSGAVAKIGAAQHTTRLVAA